MLRRVVLIALLGLGVSACITPSIPIPPPDPSLMTFDLGTTPATMGTATFQYPADNNYVGSVVSVYNRIQGTGVIEAARADGSVGPTAAFAANAGDQIEITFQREDEASSACIVLQQGTQSATNYCP